MKKYPILDLGNGDYISYNKLDFSSKIGVIFLGGFMSDKEGSKALALEEHCIKNKISFIRFDYFGHGISSRKFEECNISIWKDNVLAVIDKIAGKEKQILVGSSMGGWLMLLATLERKDRIAGLVGIASAPDFTDYLLWDYLDKETQDYIMQGNIYHAKSIGHDKEECNYLITKNLIENGRANFLLNKNSIDIDIPIRLIHSIDDEDVPYTSSIKIMEKVVSRDIKISLVKDSNHRMSSDTDLKLICDLLDELRLKL